MEWQHVPVEPFHHVVACISGISQVYRVKVQVVAVAVFQVIGAVGHAAAAMGDAVSVEADGPAFRGKLPLLGKAPLTHRISFFILSPHPPVPGAEAGRVIVEIGI